MTMTSFPYDAPYAVRRVPVMARNVVATSQPLAAQAGVRMLLKGGNAVDAALAAAITLTVVEPTGNGVGSDAFAILWDGRELHGLNASGCSPAAWTPERFKGLERMPQRGWDSVTVPGAVSAWMALSTRFGKLPFADLFEPAIAYAHDGFPVTPTIAELWRRGGAALAGQPGFAEHFLAGGKAPRAGEMFVNRNLARTLTLIAQSGGEAFYRGELAAQIAGFAREHGGALDESDLAAHEPLWSGTISARYRGADLHEIPPNGQGIAALMTLGMLEHTEVDTLAPDSAAAMHLQLEATKLAYADLARYVADHRYMEVAPAELIDPTYLASRAKLIDRKAAMLATAGAPRRGGTVYLTAADASGMMISYIQSNYAGFGSGVVVPGTGIHLQNRGFGFTLQQGHANEVAPRKRPFQTIIPGFLMKDAAPVMSFGVMGGPMQAQGHVQMVLRTQSYGQDPQTASDAPRWRFVAGRKVAVEWQMPEATVAELTALGHEVNREAPDEAFGFGGAQLIHKLPGGGYVAGSDHRKDGEAIGF